MRHNLAIRQPSRYGALLGWFLVACVLAGGLAWGSSLSARLRATTRELDAQRARITALQAELRDAERVAAPRRRAQAIKAALDRDAVDPAVLRRIEPSAPPDVWLVSADLSRGRLLLDGQALAWRSVAAFADALSRVPGLTNVQLASLQAHGAGGGYDFHISAQVAGPAPREALR